MIVKALVVLCVVSAAAGQDLDSIVGPTEPSGTTGSATAGADAACVSAEGERGECVPYYRCQLKDEVAEGAIDFYLPMDPPCESYFDVCCAPSDRVELTTAPAKVGCGWRNPDGASGVSLIRGSAPDVAEYGEFPWTCAILQINRTSNDTDAPKPIYIGGGSLIHPSVILTTAYNLPTPAQLRVRCGEWDSVNDYEPYPYQEKDVADIEVHPQFSKQTLRNNIALVFLSQPMVLSPHVGVGCLPTPLEEVGEGSKCFVVHWGKDVFGKEGRYLNLLMKAEAAPVNHRKCEEQLRRTRLGARFQLHSSLSCAGDGSYGETGMPLSCPIQSAPGRYMVSGAAAFSLGSVAPSVFTAVPALRPWVDERVSVRGYDTDVYSY